MKVTMPKFSEHRRSGKVWHSPPFYYKEGYKMCLAVYANGKGKGAGTHVSVAILHLRGEYNDKLKWPVKCDHLHMKYNYDDCCYFLVRELDHYPPFNNPVQIDCQDEFCSLNDEKILHMVNDYLTFCVEYSSCYLGVIIL